MTAATISSLSPAVLAVDGGSSVTLATESVGLSLDIMGNLHHHSGNIFPTLVAVPGANPKAQLSVPFKSAFDLLGLGLKKLTTCNLFLAKFEDFNKTSDTEHLKIGLNTGCFACAEITGWSVSVDGIIMADIAINYLSTTGALNPVLLTPNSALPSISGSPDLHTLGPVSINSSIIPGLQSSGGSINAGPVVQRSDGDLFPRVAARIQAAPSMQLSHYDSVAILNALGTLGAVISAVDVYLKSYDPANGVVGQTGGIKFAIVKGRIHPSGESASQGQVSSTDMEILGITTDGGANPFTVTTGVTVPSMT
jgi:hypothetical protein